MLVLVLTFDEADGIEMLLDQVLAAHPTLDLLFVGDGSPDGTDPTLPLDLGRPDRYRSPNGTPPELVSSHPL